jgi:ESAT-6 family protein
MTRLVVDLGALAELTERMQRFQDHLSATRDEVQRRITALHLSWTGDAAAAQAASSAQWASATAELQEALAALRSIGETARANYAAAVAANRRMWAL